MLRQGAKEMRAMAGRNRLQHSHGTKTTGCRPMLATLSNLNSSPVLRRFTSAEPADKVAADACTADSTPKIRKRRHLTRIFLGSNR